MIYTHGNIIFFCYMLVCYIAMCVNHIRYVLAMYFRMLNTYGRRAFAVAAPATWNTLSDELRNPDLHSATFRRNLKTFLFGQYLVH